MRKECFRSIFKYVGTVRLFFGLFFTIILILWHTETMITSACYTEVNWWHCLIGPRFLSLALQSPQRVLSHHYQYTCMVLSRFSCAQLFATPWTCSPPGSPVHGVLQARMTQGTQAAALQQSRGIGWEGRREGGSRGRRHMCTYGWFLLRFDRKQQIV